MIETAAPADKVHAAFDASATLRIPAEHVVHTAARDRSDSYGRVALGLGPRPSWNARSEAMRPDRSARGRPA
jgi:hypothetical protein